MSFWGLGKRRSRFGKFLDTHSISQQEIAEESGVSKSTISRLCQPDDFEPNLNTAKKIIKALKKHDTTIDYKNFWDM
jgi:putative transcriptional regulator